MYDSDRLFALFHVYNRTIEDITYKEVKQIGVFQTREECVKIINRYKHYVGFRDYPETCFKIFEYEIGKEYWRDEFM